jgi:hypothetical protein
MVEALEGSSPGQASGAVEQLSEVLLDMTASTLKIAAYVRDLDDSEWIGVAPRLRAFVAMVHTIPMQPIKKAKKVGFKMPEKSTKKPKKKARKR